MLVLSLFFHKTALFGFTLIILALFPRLLNKRTFLLVLIVYPFILLLVQLLLMQFMDTAVDASEHSSSFTVGQAYLNEDTREIGSAYLLQLIIRYLPYYMVGWIAYKTNLYQPEEETEGDGESEKEEQAEVNKMADEDELTSMSKSAPAEIRFFARLTVYVVLVSTIFLFDLGANTLNLYMRFLMYAFIPACVVLAWAWQHSFCMRLVRLTFLVGVAGTFYALLYSFYLAYLGVAE